MDSYFGNREGSLGYLAGALSRLLGNRLNTRFAAAGLGLTVEQWAALYCLWDEDGQTQQDIAAGLLLEKSTVSRALEVLERGGWVCRLRDANDARIKRVFLTDQSRAVRDECGALATEVLAEAQRDLAPEERETLRRLLARVLHSLLGLDAG
jgi:DNA-binding MarR family transcriptional regulator